MEERFYFQQAWSAHAPAQEQTVSQNFAEDKFNYLLEKIKHMGGEVSPVKRSMRILKDENERDWMVLYRQMVFVTASEEAMPHLKELVK